MQPESSSGQSVVDTAVKMKSFVPLGEKSKFPDSSMKMLSGGTEGDYKFHLKDSSIAST